MRTKIDRVHRITDRRKQTQTYEVVYKSGKIIHIDATRHVPKTVSDFVNSSYVYSTLFPNVTMYKLTRDCI